SWPITSLLGRLRGRTALRWFWPPCGHAGEHLLDQAAGLRHDLVVAAGGGAQDEFRDAGIDIVADPLDDRCGVADREIIPRLAAGALLVGLEQRQQSRVVGGAEAEGDAGAVVVVVDRPALLPGRRLDRGD